MPLLTLKRKFEEPLLTGRKTTPLRLVSCKVLPGDLCTATGAQQRTFAYLKILGIRNIRLDELGNPMARADGLRNAEELRGGPEIFYPGVEEFIPIPVRLERDAELGPDWKEVLREVRAIQRDFTAVAQRISVAMEYDMRGSDRTYDRRMATSTPLPCVDSTNAHYLSRSQVRGVSHA